MSSRTRNPRSAIRSRSTLAVALLLAFTGCIPSESLPPGAMDRQWLLDVDPTLEAPFYEAGEPGAEIPSRWVIRRNDSVIWSTVSIVRAVDRIEEGAQEVELAISPTHMEALGDVLVEVRDVLETLRNIAESGTGDDPALWANTLADVLLQVEGVARMISPDAPPQPGASEALAGGPLLDMLATYLDRRTGGGLADDLEAGDVQRVRMVFTQIVLKLGFAAAGKQPPPGLRSALIDRLEDAPDLSAMREDVSTLLQQAIQEARPAGPDATLRNVIQTTLDWAPRAVRALESFVEQWDRMDFIEVEVRSVNNEPMITATLAVAPGQEVRMADIVLFQPTLAFRGTTRVVVLSDAVKTADQAILFEPASPDGGVLLRFEGIPYLLARLFAFPLADGALREIRLTRGGGYRGTRLLHVEVLMRKTTGSATSDPRRMIVYQDVQEVQPVRTAFGVTTRSLRTERTFHYLTPDRRYTYHKVETPEGSTADADLAVPDRMPTQP